MAACSTPLGSSGSGEPIDRISILQLSTKIIADWFGSVGPGPGAGEIEVVHVAEVAGVEGSREVYVGVPNRSVGVWEGSVAPRSFAALIIVGTLLLQHRPCHHHRTPPLQSFCQWPALLGQGHPPCRLARKPGRPGCHRPRGLERVGSRAKGTSTGPGSELSCGRSDSATFSVCVYRRRAWLRAAVSGDRLGGREWR